MNASTGPPPKKGGALLHNNAPNQNHHHHSREITPVAASAQQVCSAGIIWRHWEIEAGRLFAEFWATADCRHLNAFVQHVKAMRSLAGKRRL